MPGNSTMRVSLIVSAVDKATAPIKAVSDSLSSLTSRVRSSALSASIYDMSSKIKSSALSMMSAIPLQINNLQSSLGALKNNVAAVGDRFRKSFDIDLSSIASRARSAALSIAAVGYGFKRLFLDPALSGEKLGFVLRQLADGDMAKVARWQEKLTKLDENSAFGIEELTQAFSTLKFSGIEPLDGSLQNLADALAAMGKGSFELQRASVQISQAFAKNNLEAVDIKPLIEMQIDIMGALSRATGLSREVLDNTDFKGRGREALTIALRQLGKESAGAASEYAKSVGGLFDKISGLWRRFVIAISRSGFFDVLQEKLTNLTSWIEKSIASGEFEKSAKKISSAFSSVTESLGLHLPRVLSVIGKIASSIDFIAQMFGGFGVIIDIFVYSKMHSFIASILGATGLFGPWGAAIAAIVVGLTALYDKFRPFKDAVDWTLEKLERISLMGIPGYSGVSTAWRMDRQLMPGQNSPMSGEIRVVVDDERAKIKSVKQRGSFSLVPEVGSYGVLL